MTEESTPHETAPTTDPAAAAPEDAGPGIDMSDRSRVFDRFARGVRRTPQPRSQGLGLGLAIVQRHVTAHGGSVLVEEGIGGGARFVVELPVH